MLAAMLGLLVGSPDKQGIVRRRESWRPVCRADVCYGAARGTMTGGDSPNECVSSGRDSPNECAMVSVTGEKRPAPHEELRC